MGREGEWQNGAEIRKAHFSKNQVISVGVKRGWGVGWLFSMPIVSKNSGEKLASGAQGKGTDRW